MIGYGDRCDFCLGRPTEHVDAAGEHLGRHHTEWIPTVEALISEGNLDTAEFSKTAPMRTSSDAN